VAAGVKIDESGRFENRRPTGATMGATGRPPDSEEEKKSFEGEFFRRKPFSTVEFHTARFRLLSNRRPQIQSNRSSFVTGTVFQPLEFRAIAFAMGSGVT
jgi:hypothetical protein